MRRRWVRARQEPVVWRGFLAATVALLVALAVAGAGGAVPSRLRLASRGDVAGAGTGPGSSVAADVAGAGSATAPGGAGGDVRAVAASATAVASGDRAAPGRTARHAVYDPGVSDTEIRIGGSTFTSGPAAVYGEQIAVGFAAGVNYVNEHGGINGRRVTLIVYDDGADPARQLANVKRLVEVDRVFALAMAYAPVAGQYVSQVGIPVFHLGQFNEEFTNPWWFPMGGPQRLAAMSTAYLGARRLGARSAAIFYLDTGAATFSRAFAEQVKHDWEAYGATVPVLEPFTPDQTSCSDAISKASAAKVDFIEFEIDAGKVIECGVEAQIQGYKPPKGWGGYLIGVPVIHEALGDYSVGMYAFDAFGANYQVPDYVAAVHKVSSKTETYSSVTMSYFIAALLMRDSIARLGDDITRARLRDVLDTFTNWSPHLTGDPNQPTWTFRPSCHVGLQGAYVIQIHKEADGTLRWDQITPMQSRTPLPPGEGPPPEYAACDAFTRG